MEEKNLLISPLAFNWILMAWILVPFIVRPFIKNKNWFRSSAAGGELNSVFALWNAYIITCWLVLPLILLFIQPQIRMTHSLLYFVAGSWWLRVIYEILRRRSWVKSFSQLGMIHQGLNLAVLLVGIFLIQTQLTPSTPLNAQLDLLPSPPEPVVEPADWLAYCFLITATITSSIQFFIEFLKTRPSDASQNQVMIEKLDLTCLTVGFSHLFFQTSLILFINAGLVF